jgi:hypothetical protein
MLCGGSDICSGGAGRKRLVRERTAEPRPTGANQEWGHRRRAGDGTDGAHPERGGRLHARVPGAGGRHQPGVLAG